MVIKSKKFEFPGSDKVTVLECGEMDLVFGKETGEWGNPGDGEARDEATPVGPGHFLAEAAHGIEIIGMHLVNKRSCD